VAHIAIDARVINSGTGTYVVKLLEYLQYIDTTNHYSVMVRAKDMTYWHPRNQNFTVIAADFDNYSFAEQLGFKRFLNKLSPDLVHFCMPQQPLLYRGRRVTTMHDMTLLHTYNSDKNWLIFHAKQLVGRYVWKRIAKISEYVIAISQNTKREYQEFCGIPDEKIPVIYEASETVKTALTPYPVPFDRYIIYVGQQPDYKNLRRLAEAHQKLLETHPDLGLVFVGRMNPDTESNKAYYEKRGFKNIHFTGYIPDEQRDWLLKNAVAYTFPSLMEGFGLPPLEAMAYGTPVVSSGVSCMPEILGDAAVYFDPLDTDNMAARIADVIDNETLQKELTDKGLKQVQKYSWQRMAEETHAVYMKVLDR
jgi:glycosyltransferase involved in cell wall biosynthesis